MSKLARANCERGVSTLELTLAMPAVIFALLFLIGMGHALISKQHAVVGGQFAAHYQRVRESAPNAAAASRAVSAGTETFRLSGGGDETISYTAKATPRQGLIAQLYRLNAANSQYQTSNVTNACVPNCKPFDSFARILSPEMITGIIFSGNTSGLPTGDLLSIVEGKGKKQPRQKPEGAEAPSPIKASEDSVSLLAMGMVPATGGARKTGGTGRKPGDNVTPCGGKGGEARGPKGGSRNPADQDRIAEQRERRGARRNKSGREGAGQNPHGEGENRDREQANKSPSGHRPEGPQPNETPTPAKPSRTPLPPPTRQPGEGIKTKRPLKWGDPKSPAYGHSVSTHGSKRPPQELKDRARTKGKPQGHFKDDNDIVEAEQRAPLKPGAHDIPMGREVGRVYMPDGTVRKARAIRVVRRKNGTVKTSYPIY
jgi:hypothetical protein